MEMYGLLFPLLLFFYQIPLQKMYGYTSIFSLPVRMYACTPGISFVGSSGGHMSKMLKFYTKNFFMGKGLSGKLTCMQR